MKGCPELADRLLPVVVGTSQLFSWGNLCVNLRVRYTSLMIKLPLLIKK